MAQKRKCHQALPHKIPSVILAHPHISRRLSYLLTTRHDPFFLWLKKKMRQSKIKKKESSMCRKGRGISTVILSRTSNDFSNWLGKCRGYKNTTSGGKNLGKKSGTFAWSSSLLSVSSCKAHQPLQFTYVSATRLKFMDHSQFS